MINGLVKIWVCTECQKEYLERPIMCKKCEGLKFEMKYAGMITDAVEELTELIDAYKDDKPDKNKRIRM